MSKKKVIAAGHICLDITPVFPEGRTGGTDSLLSPGKLIQMGKADVHTGGAVANTGLAMKFLGADVSLMGKVGNDAFGRIVLELLKACGADRGMIVSEDATTSYSVVLAVPGIDRIFLHHPGANDQFRAEDVPEGALEEAALFHFGYPPLMAGMYADGGAELKKLMKNAKEQGCATSLDLASVDADSPAGRADWKKILTDTLPYVDFFVPSVEELCFMLDRQRFESWQERASGGDITELLDVERDIAPLAGQCMALGCKVLLLKCGAPGMYYCTAGADILGQISKRAGIDVSAWADRSGFERSYVPDKVLSGTGAGDTSIAAFLTAMLEGYSLEECLNLASGTGAACVAAYDALSGLMNFGELRKKIAAGWEKRQ